MECDKVMFYLSELQAMIKKGDIAFNVNPFLDHEYAEDHITNVERSVSEAIKILSGLNDNAQL